MNSVANYILSHFPHQPTQGQLAACEAMVEFLYDPDPMAAFVLRGYAGTGKTTLVSALIQSASALHIKTLLLAPTGRAAKVLAGYSGKPAFTIHKKIYQTFTGPDGMIHMARALNKHTYTLFIVDEASMIGLADEGGGGHRNLLEDLIGYVTEGSHCRLMLIGDDAQLPPVGSTESPALDLECLRAFTPLKIHHYCLTEVVRQQHLSGILLNATMLRHNLMQLSEGDFPALPLFDLNGCPDILRLPGADLEETLNHEYGSNSIEEVVIITRSNKRATRFNMGVRNSILYREDLLVNDDMLLVAKNNYYWARDYDEMDFIANGDVCRVKRVWGDIERRYGLRFANVTVEFPDHDGVEMDCKIVVDCLLSDTPALDREQSERLFNEVYAELTGDKRERYKQLKEHPYFNALQVKYAYAVTCHKAQGGQWRNVFIDMGGIMPDAMQSMDFYRWLYTAITRARQRVYLINWNNDEQST